MRANRTTRIGRRSGFTILELILSLVILTIVMAVIVPRFTSNQHRQLDLTIDRVADLLAMYAQRESLSSNPVGIFHDREYNLLTLVVLDTEEEMSGRGWYWRVDRYVKPIELPEFIDPVDGVLAWADGEPIDIGEWPLMSQPGQARPRIELMISTDFGSETVTLTPHGVTPTRSDRDNIGIEDRRRTPVDLTGTGRAREEW